MNQMHTEPDMSDLQALQETLSRGGPYAIAVSGGVDSMTLAVVAGRLDPGTEMFHALSPAVPADATQRVQDYAEREGWRLSLVTAGEIDDPEYIANPANRCYFCKTNLYDTIAAATSLTIASGTNTDDLSDYRPGLSAAAEHDVVHPYVEAGISKASLRTIAGALGLSDLEELAAAPCLSSRVTTGIRIDPRLLPVIDTTEKALWELIPPSMQVDGVRCRIRPGSVGVEIETVDDLSAITGAALDLVRRVFDDAGYAHLTGDVTVEPYRRGSAFLIETLNLD